MPPAAETFRAGLTTYDILHPSSPWKFGSETCDLPMMLHDLDTPVAVVDLDRLERNIARLQSYLDEHGILSRPHIKTHKIPAIALQQVAAGAIGITCQKLGEAEAMVHAGIPDVFVPYNILGTAKLERLMMLSRNASVSVTADSTVTADGLSRAASESGIRLPVLVEFDTGYGRCGVQSPTEAAALAEYIARRPGLRCAGLMTFPINDTTDAFVETTRALLSREKLPLERVSAGGTPTMWQAHHHRSVTEYRVGTYVYGDRSTVASGAMTVEDCALTVIATVVSRPTSARAILDAGSKALSSDLLGQDGYGLLLEYPAARIASLSEEHATVDLTACERTPSIGERVTLLPNHVCVVSNLFDQVTGVRNGHVEIVWPVAARGALQ